jgi:hypothetical protein
MFVNVSIQNERSNPPILVPGDALIVDASGAHIGVLRDVRQVPPDEQQNAQKKQAETVEGPFICSRFPSDAITAPPRKCSPDCRAAIG